MQTAADYGCLDLSNHMLYGLEATIKDPDTKLKVFPSVSNLLHSWLQDMHLGQDTVSGVKELLAFRY